MRTFGSGVRAATWLGWQIESNWADVLTFVVYSVLRPLGTALILAGMYWAVSGAAARPEAFAAFYVANAFHEYVVRVLIGMG
jgi:ABC-2 type transport system permease protein